MDGVFLTFTEAQLMGWLTPIFWPFLRILALMSAAPLFSARSVPLRTRIGFALVMAVCIQPALPEPPILSLNDPRALGAVVQGKLKHDEPGTASVVELKRAGTEG